jgi:hypothetical protein
MTSPVDAKMEAYEKKAYEKKAYEKKAYEKKAYEKKAYEKKNRGCQSYSFCATTNDFFFNF